MKKSVFFVITLLIGIILNSQITGCTLLGLGIGAAASGPAETISGEELEKLEKNDRVVIHKTDGHIQKGYFRGMYFEPLDSYEGRYRERYGLREDFRTLPFPKDSISITFKSNETRAGVFEGFDKGVLYIGLESGGQQVFPLDDISYLKGPQNEGCDGLTLLSLSGEDALPFRSVLALSDRYGQKLRYIDPSDVEQIRARSKSYISTGLWLGLSVDVVIVMVGLAQMGSFSL